MCSAGPSNEVQPTIQSGSPVKTLLLEVRFTAVVTSFPGWTSNDKVGNPWLGQGALLSLRCAASNVDPLEFCVFFQTTPSSRDRSCSLWRTLAQTRRRLISRVTAPETHSATSLFAVCSTGQQEYHPSGDSAGMPELGTTHRNIPHHHHHLATPLDWTRCGDFRVESCSMWFLLVVTHRGFQWSDGA